MKNGKTTSPKRWIESSGQRSDGKLSGITRLTAANSPYGAPNRRQATTVSPAKSPRKASCARLIAATRSGRRPGRRSVAGRVRTGGELPDAGPAGTKPVPESTERPRRRELTAPGLFGAQEGERIAELPPQVERIEREQRRGSGKPEQSRAAAGPPREEHERGEQGDPERPGQPRKPSRRRRRGSSRARRTRSSPPQRAGRATRCRRLQGRARERSRGRAPPAVPRRRPGEASRAGRAARTLRDRRRARSGRRPARSARATRGRATDEQRVERVERGGRLLHRAVAILGDPEEPDAVPASPDVDQESGVAGELRSVPPGNVGMAVRVEGQVRENDGRPDRRPAPQEDVENTADGVTLLHPRGGKRAVDELRPVVEQMVDHRRRFLDAQVRRGGAHGAGRLQRRRPGRPGLRRGREGASAGPPRWRSASSGSSPPVPRSRISTTGFSTFSPSARVRRSLYAGGSARRRSPFGTAWRKVSRAGNRSSASKERSWTGAA